MTLDPQRAHPKLEVSADGREVRWSSQPLQLGGEDDCVHSQYSALANEVFSTGLHYWEVIVWEKPYWLIGLSHMSITNGLQGAGTDASADLNQVFCYIYHGNGQYLVCHGAQESPLVVGRRVRKVGVLVDGQQGAVCFYDADTLTLLQRFGVDMRQGMVPTLNPCISFGEHNTHPLILYHLSKHTHNT